MPKPHSARRIVRFGQFELDPDTGELRKAGIRLNVQDQPIQVLKLLLERPGELVTRDELRSRLWPSDTFVGFEHGLNAAVGRLREALGDAAESPRFVETMPRRGYRFISPIVLPDDERRGQSDQPLPAHTPWYQRRIATALRFALLPAALVLFGLFLFASNRKPPASVVDREGPAFQRLTFRRGGVMGARFAPDGKTVVYGAAWDGDPVRIYATRVEGPESYALPLPPADLAAISPSAELLLVLNRRYLPNLSPGVLARVPLAGGMPREVTDGVQGADWSPENGQFAVTRVIEGRSQLEYPFGNVLQDRVAGAGSAPRVSPDGQHVAFLTKPAHGSPYEVSVAISARSGKVIRISTGWQWPGGHVAWSANGDEVWFSAAKVGGVGRTELHAVSLSGHERRVLSLPSWINLQDIAPDGRVLLEVENSRGGIVCQLAGDAGERDLSWFENSVVADLSSDGRTLLFWDAGEAAGPITTYVRMTDGSAPRRLGEGFPFALSPDGQRVVAFDETAQQFIILPIGAGEPKRLHRSGVQRGAASWFPDGKRLLLVWGEDGRRQRTYVVDPLGGSPQPIGPEGFGCELLSPDGKSAVCEMPSGPSQIYSLERETTSAIRGLTENDRFLQWGPDSRSLFLRVEGELPVRVYRLDLLSGKRELRAELKSDSAGLYKDAYYIRLAAGGRSLCYTMFHAFNDLYLVTGLR